MTQALQSPYAVPVLQIVAAVAVLQIISGGNLSLFVAERLTEIKNECLNSARKMIYDSPVIAISAGLTYLVQEFVAPKIPFLSLSMPGWTPLKTTMIVAGLLAVRSALSPYLERVIVDKEGAIWEKKKNIARNLRNAVILNVVPVAAACTAAFYAEVPVKLIQTAIFTTALIPMVKLLGKGFENFVNLEHVKETADKVFAWMQ